MSRLNGAALRKSGRDVTALITTSGYFENGFGKFTVNSVVPFAAALTVAIPDCISAPVT
nr:MAG TPA: hypothetical protein [Bacteriophage sp.]